MSLISKIVVSIGLGVISLTMTLAQPKDPRENTLEELIKENPSNLTARQRLATLRAARQDHQGVVALLSPYTSEVDVPALLLLAQAYHKLEQYAQEVQTLQQVLLKAPNSSNAHLNLGLAHMANKQNEKGIVALRKAIELEPKNKRAYEALLETFRGSKNNYESRMIVKDMIQRFGKKASYLSEMCRLNSEDGYIDEAIKACKKAIAKDPKNPANHTYLALTYQNKRELKMAESILIRASRRFKKSELVQFTTGDFFLDKKAYSTAARFFDRAVKADGKSVRSQLGRAEAHFAIEGFDQSLESYLQACRLDKRQTRPKFLAAMAKLGYQKKSSHQMKWKRKAHLCR